MGKSYISYSWKELGWDVLALLRVYRKDSTLLINNRLSLQPSWHTTGSVCDCQSVVWLTITKRNHTNSCVQKLSSSEVLQDILFMSVRWWCKTDELWDVLLKHAYICRERLSLHSGGVLQGSIRYSYLAEGGDVGTDRAPHPVSLWRVSMWSALILFSSYWQWYGHWKRVFYIKK